MVRKLLAEALQRNGTEVITAGDGEEALAMFRETIGFDERYLERIFRPFRRLHGRARFQGSGVGLAICRKIVERHGGTITARSPVGEGSAFLVRLPV
jgi:light-regulated signal transduction histidine kinase (bacteriophytochrome)